jgi:hypothetical protein
MRDEMMNIMSKTMNWVSILAKQWKTLPVESLFVPAAPNRAPRALGCSRRMVSFASLGLCLAAIIPLNGHAAGALTNGANEQGTLSTSGQQDSWTFTAQAGDAIMLRMVGTNLTPSIQLLGPNGSVVAAASSGNGAGRDDFLTAQATNAGFYTVVVSAKFANQTGGYGLTLAQAPGPFVVSPGDEGGVLTNGVAASGTIALGDVDMWSFSANAGDNLMVRMGATNLTPWIRLIAPDGALVAEANVGNGASRDDYLIAQATNSGTYTVVVSAKLLGQSGDYTLTLAQAPGPFVVSAGDQGGVLTNGVANSGTIALGDLDMWSFTANAGDNLMVRMGTTPGLTPWIRLLGPDGALVDQANSGNGAGRDDYLIAQATNSGTYTVVVSAKFLGQSGDYTLTLDQAPGPFVISPGDQGGVLTNGVANVGTLPVGDSDIWSFTANAGDNLMIRMGATNLTPWIRLLGPNGAQVAEANVGNGATRDDFLTAKATNAGTYTVVVGAKFLGQSGDYTLTLAQAREPFVVSPGDDGGPLTNAFSHVGTLALGDLDMWSFFGTPGDSNVLRVVSTNFTPWIRVFGPDGAVVKDTTSGGGATREGSVSFAVTNAGMYTAVVSATFQNQSGTYALRQSRVPPDLNVPETQEIAEGQVLNVSISAQDPDVLLKPLTFNLLSAPAGVTITTASQTNAILSWATSEADGPGTNIIVATVTDIAGQQPFTRTNSFTVIVREINTPPTLIVPPDQVLDEMTPLTVSASATDADVPANPLTFSLASAPEGMTIDAKTGVISWIPTEAQGPLSTTVAVVVTDDSPFAANAQHLSVTNTFNVVVREVNSAPVLPAQGPRTLDELTTLVVMNTASDSDIPANTLTYVLVSAPTNAVISSQGVITWTPSEAQGPSTNTFVTVVSDNGVPSRSATNTFTVVVNEVNAQPVLQVIPDQSLHYGTLLSLQAVASDSDLPANTLTFSVDQPPAGLAINAGNGAITWTPAQNQVGTYAITVRVSDNGSPSLSATNTFQITVTGEGTHLGIQPQAGGLVKILVTGDVGNTYDLQKSTNFLGWDRIVQIPLSTSPFSFIDPDSATEPLRFYRLKLVSPP